MQEYTNRETGEIYEVENTDLTNICEGLVNYKFRQSLRLLVENLESGQSGKIKIQIKISKSVDHTGDNIVIAEANLGIAYPNTALKAGVDINIDEDGHLVQRKEQSMFNEESEEEEEAD